MNKRIKNEYPSVVKMNDNQRIEIIGHFFIDNKQV